MHVALGMAKVESEGVDETDRHVMNTNSKRLAPRCVKFVAGSITISLYNVVLQ
jgi:hypothetical protein